MRLIHWEALEEMQKMEDNSVDFIFADLPYSDKLLKRITANKWDKWINLEEFFKQVNRILKEDWVMCMTATNPFSFILWYKSIEFQQKYKWNLKYKYEWIWEKSNLTNFASVNHQPWRVHEQILVFWRKATTYAWKNATEESYMKYNEQRTKWESYAIMSWKWASNNLAVKEWKSLSVWTENTWDRRPRTIQKFKQEKRQEYLIEINWEIVKEKSHPTNKPVKLIEYLLKTYTKEWDLVLDPTMWGWSCWVACKNLNRDFIWIELKEEYFKIAEQRILNNK